MPMKATHPTIRGRTILVVDDNAHMRRLVGTLLDAVGAGRVIEADCAEAALELLYQRPDLDIDLMVLDWRMKAMTGLELAQHLRDAPDSPAPDLPILLVSAYVEDGDKPRLRAMGINGVLAKPIGMQSLLCAVGDVLAA